MSANNCDYAKMFGMICCESMIMAKCACVACNSCTCGCSCRYNTDMNNIDWE